MTAAAAAAAAAAATTTTTRGEYGSEEEDERESKEMWAFECADPQSDISHKAVDKDNTSKSTSKRSNHEAAAALTVHSSSSRVSRSDEMKRYGGVLDDSYSSPTCCNCNCTAHCHPHYHAYYHALMLCVLYFLLVGAILLILWQPDRLLNYCQFPLTVEPFQFSA